MHIISQNLSERIIQNMCEGVVWQDPLPPMFVPLAGDFVSNCKGAVVCSLSCTYMQDVACSNLQS